MGGRPMNETLFKIVVIGVGALPVALLFLVLFLR